MEDPPYIASDVSQLGHTFLRVTLRDGPPQTGRIDARGWIDVPANMAHILRQRFEVMAMESNSRAAIHDSPKKEGKPNE